MFGHLFKTPKNRGKIQKVEGEKSSKKPPENGSEERRCYTARPAIKTLLTFYLQKNGGDGRFMV